LRIKIENWESYQPRKELKSLTWFRMSTLVPFDAELHGLHPECKWVWVCILSLAAQKNSGEVTLDIPHLSHISGTDANSCLVTIEHLKDRGVISTDPHKSVQPHTDTNTKTCPTDKTDKTYIHTYTLPETCSRPVKKTRKKKVWPTTDSDLAIGSEWLEFGLSEMPWKKNDKAWTSERFGQAIAEIKSKTDLNDLGLREILKFIREDDFWVKNAVSPLGLLRKSEKNGNRKIDNILIRMKTPEERKRQKMNEWVKKSESPDYKPFVPFEDC